MAFVERELSILISAKDEASKTIGSIGSKIGIAMAAGAASVAAAGAAVGAFAVKSIKDFSEVGDEVEKMATRTGLSAKAVSALRVAADASGTSIDTIEAAVTKMNISMVDASSVSDDLKDAIVRTGGSVNDLFAPGSNPAIRFEYLAETIGQVKDPAEKARLAFDAFGKAGKDLIPLMDDGKFAIADWSKQAEALGVSFDDLSAKKAADLNDAIGAMNTAIKGVSLQVGGFLAPAITAFVNDVIVPTLPKLQALAQQGFGLLKDAITFVVDTIKMLYDELKQTGIIDAFSNAFLMLWGVITTQLWPAIQELWLALQPILPFVEKLAEVFGTVLVAAILAAVTILTTMISIMAGVVTAIAKFVDKVLKDATPAINGLTAGLQNIIDTVKSMIDWFNSAISAIDKFLAKVKDVSSSVTSGVLKAITGGSISGTRALGGPVTSGSSYLVGENGPELFTAPSGGTVIPNNRLGFGGSLGVNVSIQVGSVSSDMDVRRMAEQVGNILLGQLNQNLAN